MLKTCYHRSCDGLEDGCVYWTLETHMRDRGDRKTGRQGHKERWMEGDNKEIDVPPESRKCAHVYVFLKLFHKL